MSETVLAVPLRAAGRWRLVVVCRDATGLMMVVAAVLKLQMLFVAEWIAVNSRVFFLATFVVAVLELFYASLLLSRRWVKELDRASVLLFSVFAVYQMQAMLSGNEICHCFGVLRPPQQLILALDGILLVFFLAVCVNHWHVDRVASRLRDSFAGLLVCFALLASFCVLMLGPEARGLAGDEEIDGGGFLVLHPAHWTGEVFPKEDVFGGDLEVSMDELTHVLVMRDGCEECHEHAKHIAQVLDEDELARVLVVLLDRRASGQWNGITVVGASQKKRLLVNAPVFVRLENGRVQSVVSDVQKFLSYFDRRS
ncbi:MAG: MauE/DoxX family redox-associated membrane protein [Planctomycetota bacterium]